MLGLLSISLLAGSTFAWNPRNDYAPTTVNCPKDEAPFRRAFGLGTGEQQFFEGRKVVTHHALVEFLKRVNLSEFDPEAFLSNTSITTGLAFSGGSFKSFFTGAGQLAALDARTTTALDTNHLGGILQSSTYISGLSASSWLVGTFALNNFSSIEQLQADPKLWNFGWDVIDDEGRGIFADAVGYAKDLAARITGKAILGYEISLNDVWGQILADKMIKTEGGAPALDWSDIRNFDLIKDYSMPYPILLGLLQTPGEHYSSGNSTIVEFTPHEFGSWDTDIDHMTDIKYLGSTDHGCTEGYDNAGFVMAASSSLLEAVVNHPSLDKLRKVIDFVSAMLFDGRESNDLLDAIIKPNPFGDAPVDGQFKSRDKLYVVDGSMDGQKLPILPYLQPERKVDVVFAFDNSEDTIDKLPDGTALQSIYERQFHRQGENLTFPYVSSKSLYDVGLGGRPLFFGCNITNLTSLVENEAQSIPPMVIYIPNSQYSYGPTSEKHGLGFRTSDVNKLVTNGYETVTRGNGTYDGDWASCVACAMVQREMHKRGQTPTQQCQDCFSKYCWGGYGDNWYDNRTPQPRTNHTVKYVEDNSTEDLADDGENEYTPYGETIVSNSSSTKRVSITSLFLVPLISAIFML